MEKALTRLEKAVIKTFETTRLRRVMKASERKHECTKGDLSLSLTDSLLDLGHMHGFNICEYNYVVQALQYYTRGPKEFNIIEFTSENKTKVETTGWPKAFNMLN